MSQKKSSRSPAIQGAKQLVEALQVSHPGLSDQEADTLAGIMLVETSKQVADGAQVAFLKRNRKGRATLTVLDLKILDKDA